MADFRVLVVEDSPTMRQLIIFSLKRLRNLEIVEANDGVEGLKKMSEKKFDLVLTDINMPVMDGIKLITLIRKDDTHKDVPIVVITPEGGYKTSGDVSDVLWQRIGLCRFELDELDPWLPQSRRLPPRWRLG